MPYMPDIQKIEFPQREELYMRSRKMKPARLRGTQRIDWSLWGLGLYVNLHAYRYIGLQLGPLWLSLNLYPKLK